MAGLLEGGCLLLGRQPTDRTIRLERKVGWRACHVTGCGVHLKGEDLIAPCDDRDVGACVWKCRREAQPLDARGALDRRPHWRRKLRWRRSGPREEHASGDSGRGWATAGCARHGAGAWLKNIYRSGSAHWEGLRVLVNRQPRLRASTTEGIEKTAWGVPANV